MISQGQGPKSRHWLDRYRITRAENNSTAPSKGKEKFSKRWDEKNPGDLAFSKYKASSSDSKEFACNEGDLGSLAGKIRWRRSWQPTQYSCLENSHGQRSLAGYSLWGHKESDKAEWLTQHYTTLNIWSPSVCDCILHPPDDRWSPCPSLSVPVKSVKPEFPLYLSCCSQWCPSLRPPPQSTPHSSGRNFIHRCPCSI